MRILRLFLIALWRIWFYILLAIPILVMFPLLLLFSSREKWYPQFFLLARWWAYFILFGMGFIPQIKGAKKIRKGESYMLVANHTSMTDIMLMLVTTPNPFVFVGKKELAKIPLFGFFYKRTCILVDRGNPKSRREVFDRAQERLKNGTSICIFPEGGVPEDETLVLDDFKDGAFRLAIDHQIPIIPITFYDNKKRLPYSFFKGGPGRMRVKVHDPVITFGKAQTDKRILKQEVRNEILGELERAAVRTYS